MNAVDDYFHTFLESFKMYFNETVFLLVWIILLLFCENTVENKICFLRFNVQGGREGGRLPCERNRVFAVSSGAVNHRSSGVF